MMKLAASVSLAALALAACSTMQPAPVGVAANDTPGTTDAPPAPQYALTPDGARAFVAAVEKDLYDFSLISNRAQWVNNTYINDDSDAVAAYFGTISTEKGVKYATEAAKYAATASESSLM